MTIIINKIKMATYAYVGFRHFTKTVTYNTISVQLFKVVTELFRNVS